VTNWRFESSVSKTSPRSRFFMLHIFCPAPRDSGRTSAPWGKGRPAKAPQRRHRIKLRDERVLHTRPHRERNVVHGRAHVRISWPVLCPVPASSHTVLDVGCGPGSITLGITERVAKVHAVDFGPSQIESAKENAERAGVRNAEFSEGSC
jgi:2-polyprenyl-3-methyl-5-hydroxy-6-metoxy-1,4-benzoquinol methylase